MNENQNGPYQPYVNAYQGQPYYYYPQASPAYYPMYQSRQSSQQPQSSQQQGQQVPYAGQGQGQAQGQGEGTNNQGELPMQESYIENILRLNKGKLATVYMTFEGANAQTFKGVVEAAGRDHIILSDPQTDKRYLLLMVYLDYITFDEEINYSYPYGNDNTQMANYSPRS